MKKLLLAIGLLIIGSNCLCMTGGPKGGRGGGRRDISMPGGYIALNTYLGVKSGLSEIQNDLIKAIETGNLKDVDNAVGKGANINVKVEFVKIIPHGGGSVGYYYPNLSMLAFALEKGNLEIIKFLTTKDTNITAEEPVVTATILTFAVQNNLMKMIQDLLLNKKIDINGKNYEGKTAIMKAIEADNIDMVRYLMNNGADINAKDKNGKSVLQLANEKGNLSIVRLLVGTDK